MLSILIVNWNTKDLLLDCLASLHRFAPAAAWEVIVVDNASDDGSAEAVRAAFPGAGLLANAVNRGYAAANNQAIKEAKGDLLLTLNPDTEVVDGSLQRSVEWMNAHPGVGVLAARLENPDGSPQASVRGFPRPWAVLWDIVGLARLFPNSPAVGSYRARGFDYSLEQACDQPMGTFLLFRRSALDAVGGMDERFPIFFNEVDLLWRLRQAGWQAWYSPDVRVRHFGGASTRQVRRSMIWESHRSLIGYWRTWHERWWNFPFMAILYGIVWLGALVRARGWDAGFRT